jgi:hypothetical protein
METVFHVVLVIISAGYFVLLSSVTTQFRKFKELPHVDMQASLFRRLNSGSPVQNPCPAPCCAGKCCAKVSCVHAAILADSVADFQPIKGQDNWYYGYYDGPFGPSDFTQMAVFTGTKWRVDNEPDGYWTLLADMLAHPDGTLTSGGRTRRSIGRCGDGSRRSADQS